MICFSRPCSAGKRAPGHGQIAEGLLWLLPSRWSLLHLLHRFSYSSGSSLMIVAPRLLPTQKVGGLVELSTFTRRTLVVRGRRYSVTSPALVFTRTMWSLDIPPVQAYPALSRMASYGFVQGVGTAYSWNFSVLASNIPILLPRYSPNHSRSCGST